MTGFVYTRTETFHIDPVEDHYETADGLGFDHIIYRLSDMDFKPFVVDVDAVTFPHLFMAA